MIISNYFYNLESTKEAGAEQFSGYSTPTIDKEPKKQKTRSSYYCKSFEFYWSQ